MQKHYYIKTYGCQMNVHESEKLAGMLKSLDYTETNDMANADVIVFNTCCIRNAAEQKILGNIGSVKKLKKLNPNLVVAVCGCMAQEEGRVELFKEKYPYVSIVFGTHNLHKFKDYLIQYNKDKQRIFDIWDTEKEINEDVDMYRTSDNNAWVNIMYGCNNFCTYCIVPYVRGRERSRAMKDIVDEVKQLIAQGYKYITLLGQNVNSYGNDFKDGTNFAQLLTTLASLDGDFRIKFMTSHPKDLTDEVINVIATQPKISKVIHLPVQSGSNKILKLMNRNYTVEHYKTLIDKIKAQVPNYFISTDIIVGFPHETEEDFMETYNLVNEVKYGGVYGFMYSPRTGTIAEKMDEQVPQEVKNERVNRLLGLSKCIIKEQNKELIGAVREALVESKDGNTYYAVLDCGKNVIIESNQELQLPTFKNVLIKNIERNKLIAEFKD
ncbi:MAG: tRNA (N6-isopentenyl adenosine(37)-C2)-methylthiotransferase MiaB [Eubacteriales bacterium]|nr:tRNA (N6-isopentenyl adenosine(37)-C2)-methylthiotransferase MiaB [Eubacteriales bacterium]